MGTSKKQLNLFLKYTNEYTDLKLIKLILYPNTTFNEVKEVDNSSLAQHFPVPMNVLI